MQVAYCLAAILPYQSRHFLPVMPKHQVRGGLPDVTRDEGAGGGGGNSGFNATLSGPAVAEDCVKFMKR